MAKIINTVCIIDDDPIYVFGTKKLMERLDFCMNFVVYKNGKEAIDNLTPLILTEDTLPEVILLDLNMPIMDGWQVLDELSKLPISEGISIYIVSSSVDPRDLKRVEDYSFVKDYLLKPFSIEKLNALISEISQKP